MIEKRELDPPVSLISSRAKRAADDYVAVQQLKRRIESYLQLTENLEDSLIAKGGDENEFLAERTMRDAIRGIMADSASDGYERAVETFSAGRRFRIKGDDGAMGTIVARPKDEVQRIGIPVIMDGDRAVTYLAAHQMEIVGE